MRRSALRPIAAAALAALALPASANWTASGRMLYEHRDWDVDGFTGTVTALPVRYADVEVIDPTKSGSKSHLAWGKTDANGNFSVPVSDSTTRSRVRVRVLTQTVQTSDLFVKVTTQGGSVYAANSSEATNHGPNTNVNWGTLVAVAFGGGEAFNILDLAIFGADYVKALTGSRPDSRKLVAFKWQIDGGVGNSTTSGSTVSLRDNAGYDDTVILHEWSHYVMSAYSKSSNPGGTHYLAACDEDPRLTFDEARASFFGCSVRRFNGWPNANVYIRTDGASGPGHVQNGYDLEDPVQYLCPGDQSETTNSRTLWDIGDGPSTTDLTPGSDDDPPDALVLPDAEVWQVFTGPIKSATYVTPESFWDGWFDATVANGHLPEMRSIWGFYTVEFWPDAYEPNDSAASATPIATNDPPLHLTFFSDPGGDGKGQADTDWFRFAAVSGQSYRIQTMNLLSANDTILDLIDSNGSTVLVSNNDRAVGDKSSLITWTAPRTNTFYVRAKHASGMTMYGSYDLSLTSP